MSYVVTQPCFGCKHTECVTVCPVDCFHEGEQMLFINPECCTECGACASVCPTNAIYAEDDVPEDQRSFIELNAEMSQKCPAITEPRR